MSKVWNIVDLWCVWCSTFCTTAVTVYARVLRYSYLVRACTYIKMYAGICTCSTTPFIVCRTLKQRNSSSTYYRYLVYVFVTVAGTRTAACPPKLSTIIDGRGYFTQRALQFFSRNRSGSDIRCACQE